MFSQLFFCKNSSNFSWAWACQNGRVHMTWAWTPLMDASILRAHLQATWTPRNCGHALQNGHPKSCIIGRPYALCFACPCPLNNGPPRSTIQPHDFGRPTMATRNYNRRPRTATLGHEALGAQTQRWPPTFRAIFGPPTRFCGLSRIFLGAQFIDAHTFTWTSKSCIPWAPTNCM